MEKRGSSPLRGLILVLTALTVIAAALVLEGILSRQTGGLWPWFTGAPPPAPALGKVTYIQRFTRCGDTASTVEDVPREQIGGMVASLASGWKVTQSGDGNVEASKDTDAYCPEHRDFRLIALYGVVPAQPPLVCVFRGKKADPAYLVREVRGLTESRLYKKDRDLLRSGVVIGPGTANPVPEDSDVDEVVAVYLQGIAEGR